MQESREPRSIIEDAEHAAAAGNYASAEQLLRDAAGLQEASLGAVHPDLANTLNNLGIVCEITKKPDDAERFFRRAVSIATIALDADHPFVATSRKNLRDFCEARGIPVEPPAPAPVPEPEAAPAAAVVLAAAPAPEPAPATRENAEPYDPELESRKFFSRVALGALGPIAMLMVVLAAGLPRLGSPEQVVPALPVPSPPPREVTPASAPLIVEPVAPEETAPPAVGEEEHEQDAAETASRPTVSKANLCAAIDDWLCDPADRPVPSGPLFFYTQLRSATATTVEHRWYRDGRLNKTVALRVEANPAPGYRTYSRNVMSGDSVGNWRVELRSQDGALLHEERFTVR